MEHYTLQKRIILSFETKLYEDGDTDYTYVVDALTLSPPFILSFVQSR